MVLFFILRQIIFIVPTLAMPLLTAVLTCAFCEKLFVYPKVIFTCSTLRL